MLIGLSIRNIVLIDQLDLEYGAGLFVLTGETGAGKSILMDALGLTLGARSESRLVRHGEKQGSATATFQLQADHPALVLLEDQGFNNDGDILTLRRVVTQDGRSRAFVNNQAASVSFLREVGESLVEIQGQFDQHGLMDVTSHIHVLDSFGQCVEHTKECQHLHGKWLSLKREHARALKDIEAALREEEFLRHSVEELTRFGAEDGEDDALHAKRTQLQNAEKLIEGLSQAAEEIGGRSGADALINQCQRGLAKLLDRADGMIDEVLDSLERASVELQEAASSLNHTLNSIETSDTRLDDVEERLFALRELARKHGVHPNDLPGLLDRFEAQLKSLDDSSEHVIVLENQMEEARQIYEKTARTLSKKRLDAAKRLDDAVNCELPPLKLEKAIFSTEILELPENQWHAGGMDQVTFKVMTNPGTPPGPLSKIASGGELSRFLLALKVSLAETGTVPTIVFDEIDSGVGGATADAIGDRLSRLAESIQVMAITHSPQVAARGSGHLKVSKFMDKDRMASSVRILSHHERREELARMLSGANVTEQARAAADQLLKNPEA